MCAINGITKNDTPRVALMNERTKHRGPDGSRVWEGEGITLGHNRLAIIDLSDRALQPMHTTDGRYHIVFNGEIYNYPELRAELESNYQFQTTSDTEVLLVAYMRWGKGMLNRLRGIFAFGIWDSVEKELTLVRDQMGVKPLYYEYEGGTLSFSSELQGLQITGKKLDHDAVGLFLELQYVPSDRTFIQGVKKLPPGHYLVMKEGAYHVTQYFNHLQTGLTPQAQKSLYETIDGAVHRQLVSERPLGVFLSGGLDSSIVLHHTRAHLDSVRTFSIAFEGVDEGGKYNADADLAEKTAQHYGTKHQRFVLSNGVVAKNLESIYQVLDEPVSTSTSVSQYFLNKFVREEGVVVALGGDGGDELFGGYTRHRALMAAYLFQKLPGVAQAVVRSLHPRGKKLQTPFFTPLHLELMATNDVAIRRTLTHDLHTMETARAFFDQKYEYVDPSLHPLHTYMRVDRHTWLPDHSLCRSDRTSMIHGIEFRVPLLDLDVVAYADEISAYRKTGVLVGKKIIRDTYAPHLPPHLLHQPKRGWLSPGAKWLRDEQVNPVVRSILSNSYYDGLGDLFDWDAVQTMLAGHVDRGHYAFHPLWSILILQIWARKYSISW